MYSSYEELQWDGELQEGRYVSQLKKNLISVGALEA